ncbi:MAG: hypothetical protein WCJ25_02375 [Candidatus Moraniibacteriota bacterium]
MISNRSGRGDAAGDRDRIAAYRRAQSDYLIFDQDIKKKTRYHEALVAEVRQLKMNLTRIEITLRDKQAEETKLARELGILQTEANRLKKRMNMLG